jgi:hypothetical protein
MLHHCSEDGVVFHGRADALVCSARCRLARLRRVRAQRRKGKRRQRDPLDRYYTDDADAAAIVAVVAPVLPRGRGAVVVEPSAGGGAFVRAIRAHTDAPIVAVDHDPNAPALREQLADYHARADFTAWDGGGLVIGAILGNPPYRDAEAHVRRALQLAGGGPVVFLLRLGFRSSGRRAPFWREFPPAAVRALAERPSFTGDGSTDATDYGVFAWNVAPEPGIGDLTIGPMRPR